MQSFHSWNQKESATHLSFGLRKSKPGSNGRIGARLGKVLEGRDGRGKPVKKEGEFKTT